MRDEDEEKLTILPDEETPSGPKEPGILEKAFGSVNGNPFGLSDTTFGIILVIFSGLVASLQATMFDIALDRGISSNCLVFSAEVCSFIGIVSLDLHYYRYGYAKDTHVCSPFILEFTGNIQYIV